MKPARGSWSFESPSVIESAGLAGAPTSGFGLIVKLAPPSGLPAGSFLTISILAQVLTDSGKLSLASLSCDVDGEPPVRLRMEPCPKFRQVSGRSRAAMLTEAVRFKVRFYAATGIIVWIALQYSAGTA